MGLLALLALQLRRVRAAFWALALGTAWLYLCSTALFADYLMGTLEDPFTPKSLSATPRADIIVLLGGAIRGDVHMGTLGDLSQSADRLVHAVALYKAGKAPRVLVTGGAAPGNRSEAEITRDLLLVMGVPAGAVLLEEASRNSYDNAVHTAAMLTQMGAERILLVTSAFHMRRSVAVFAAQGVAVIPAPTDYQRLAGHGRPPRWLPTVSDLWQSTYALHEIVGYWVYRYRGWL